jgi:ribosomal-protein-serine acetyltransferase
MRKTEPLHVAPAAYASPVMLADAAPLAALVSANLAHLVAYLPQVAALSDQGAAREHLEYAIAAAADGSLHEWHIFAGGELCGAIRVNHIEAGNRKASIAYYLSSSQQGKGLATRSVRAVIAWCFEHLGLNRIELRCASVNLASQSVAKRLGFTWEGMLRQAELLNGSYADHFVYGLLKSEFDALAEMEQAA